jgi:hypothetical protein
MEIDLVTFLAKGNVVLAKSLHSISSPLMLCIMIVLPLGSVRRQDGPRRDTPMCAQLTCDLDIVWRAMTYIFFLFSSHIGSQALRHDIDGSSKI